MRIALGGALAAATLLTAGAADAATIAVVNADFNNAYVAPYDGERAAGHSRGLPGWSGGSSTAQWNPTVADFTDHASRGVVAWSRGTTLNASRGSDRLTQDIKGVTLQANTRYTLSLDVGNAFERPNEVFGYSIGLIGGDFGPGSTILASLTGATDMFGNVIGMGQFGRVQLVFDTGDTGDWIGKSFGISLMGTGKGAAFDNLVLDATALQVAGVPEPATWAMMILGFGASGAVLRRRRGWAVAV
jgi:hypothetical protein